MDVSEKEIVTVRVFNKPCEILFKAWTDPRLLAQWWGPKGFTNTFHEFDLRPGGPWIFTMNGPSGTRYKNKSVFIEIVRPQLVVFDHLEPAHKFRATTTFENLGNDTKVTFRMRFDSPEECRLAKRYVGTGNEQNFDRLEAVLAKSKS